MEKPSSMEKPTVPKSKSKIFSFLPKTATVSFKTNYPFSPSRDKRSENFHKHKAFSGPIISIIPAEARTKSRTGSFHTQEPTSPKVSCMGQIKHKKKICSKATLAPPPPPPQQKKQPKRSTSSIRDIFRRKKSESPAPHKPSINVVDHKTPALGQMKRFSSGRDTFGSQFDWKNFDAKVVPNDHRNYFSDDEDRDSFEEDEEEEEEDEIIIPHSAPIMIGGGAMKVPTTEPRKEINLWKRRTMVPPRPLKVNDGKP